MTNMTTNTRMRSRDRKYLQHDTGVDTQQWVNKINPVTYMVAKKSTTQEKHSNTCIHRKREHTTPGRVNIVVMFRIMHFKWCCTVKWRISHWIPDSKYVKKGEEVVGNDFIQLNDIDTFIPYHASELSKDDKSEPLRYLVFLKGKRDGTIKARGCADRRPQRAKYDKWEEAALTIDSAYYMSCEREREWRGGWLPWTSLRHESTPAWMIL